MIRKIFALLMMLTVCLSAAGCGSSSDQVGLDVDYDDFVDDFNDDVSVQLKIIGSNHNQLYSLSEINPTAPKYMIAWGEEQRILRYINVIFSFKFYPLEDSINDPNVRKMLPKGHMLWTLLETEEEVFTAAINAVNDGWLLGTKDILKRIGFYDADGNILMPTNEVSSQFKERACISGDKIYQLTAGPSNGGIMYSLLIQGINTYDYKCSFPEKLILQAVSFYQSDPIKVRRYSQDSIPQQTIESINENIAVPVEQSAEPAQTTAPAQSNAPASSGPRFDGTKFGLNDLSDEEQKTANAFLKRGIEENEIYNEIMRGRADNGGMPIDRAKGLGITDKRIEAGAQLQTGDLMLGAIALGDSQESVVKKMGQPPKTETSQYGTLLYKYGAIDIGFKDGKVVVMVTGSPISHIKTPRDISSEFTSIKDVERVYGKPNNITEEDGLGIYEYKITSQDNRPALLRFAFKLKDDDPHSTDAQGRNMSLLNPKRKGQLTYINIRYE